MNSSNRRAYLNGLLTLFALGALTWFEFQVDGELIGLLLVIGIAKAAIIAQVFMHISRLWGANQ